jgi:calcineurin-like phosphoesterase family protein
MNKEITKRHNEIVTSEDTVIHVGDFTLNQDAEKYISQLNGHHIFLLGSHDRWLKNKRTIQIWEKLIEKHYVVVCHYAMRTWARSHYNSWNLYAHCLSEDTELLTKDGFKFYNEITNDDYALTLNLYSNFLEYKKINNIYKYYYTGDLISFKCRSGEILVTPNHTMLYKTNLKRYLFEEKALNLINRQNLILPVNSISKGTKYDVSNDFLVVLGLIISDGHFHKSENGYPGNGISIYQKSTNEKFIEDRLNFAKIPYNKKYRTVRNVNMTVFYIPALYVKENIYKWITEKKISSSLMELRKVQFRALLSGLLYGDGQMFDRNFKRKDSKDNLCLSLIENGFDNKIMYQYFTKDNKLKDQLTQLCTLNGVKAKSSWRISGFKTEGEGSYTITIVNNSFVILPQKKREIKKYSGVVWCVSTDNRTLVSRRNGFVFISGNSHGKLPSIGKSLDIGVDTNNFYPYSFEQIKEIMKTKPDNPNIIKKHLQTIIPIYERKNN